MSGRYPSPCRGNALLELDIQSVAETSLCESGKCDCAQRLARRRQSRSRQPSTGSSTQPPTENAQTETERYEKSWIDKSGIFDKEVFDQVAILKPPEDNSKESSRSMEASSRPSRPSQRTDSLYERSGSLRRMKKFPFVRCRQHMRELSDEETDDESSIAFGENKPPDSLAEYGSNQSVPTLPSRKKDSGVAGLWSDSKTGSSRSLNSNGSVYENESSELECWSYGGTGYPPLSQRVAVNPIIHSEASPVRHRLRVQNQFWPTFPKERTEESSSEEAEEVKVESESEEDEETVDPKEEELYREIFAGCKSKSEIAKELRPNRFLLYYLKAKNIRVEAPLRLGYMSQAGVTFHFPVQRTQVESARERRWSWKVDSGESADDQPTFSTLTALARYYKTHTYWEPKNRSAEAFPIWNEQTKKFARHP